MDFHLDLSSAVLFNLSYESMFVHSLILSIQEVLTSYLGSAGVKLEILHKHP